MRKDRRILAATGLAAMLAALSGVASASDYKDGELIVKYRDGAVRSRVEMNTLYDAAGVRSIKHLTGIMSGMDQVILQDNVKMQDAIAAFLKNPNVEYVQPNYILHAYPVYKIKQRAFDGGGGLPCIPGFEIPGCTPAGGGGGGGGLPGLPGLPGGGDGGGLPGLPGGGNGGGGDTPCLIPGIPFPPGCKDADPNPNPNPNPGPVNPPATRPAIDPMPADVDPPVADPDLGKAYGLAKIGATEAWKDFRGSKDFIVADIDTGIDYNHEDLAFNIYRGTESGKTVIGHDFVHNDDLPFDDNEHGTHTAGTIGAVGGNGKGVSGVAQRVSLMSVKFLSGEGSGTTADAIRAIDWAVAHGAKVLSNSWGGKGDDNNAALKEAIERARAKDVLFVAAAGNDGTDNDGSDPSYPASFDNDNMIAVAATDNADAMAFFSNYGKKTTHLAAPGVNVYSTVPGNKYAQLSGTSMACPHVAGAAALLWARHPDWNYKKVKEVLLSTTDHIAALDGKTVTGGRLNILKALRSTE